MYIGRICFPIFSTMSTAYSVHSVGSYMKAMEVMVESVQSFPPLESYIVPEVDNELEDDTFNNNGNKLLVMSQDRNEWDEIFDQFSNLSSERLQKLISNKHSTSNAQSQIFKELFRLLDQVESDFPRDQLLEQLIELLRNNESTGTADQDLFDYLGA